MDHIDGSCSLWRLIDAVRSAWGCDPTIELTLHLGLPRHIVTPRFDYIKSKPAMLVVEKPGSEIGVMAYLVSTTPANYTSNLESFRGRMISPHRIDYGIIRNWMQHCQSKHKDKCAVQVPRRPSSMKLIDCSSRKLVKASDHDLYLALSYVWGQGTMGESTWDPQSEVLPVDLPKTVEDAIIVTKALDFKYLWVDKYCINQSDPKELEDQLKQMDLIYLNAELTIVGGSGHSSRAGLPGVSSVERLPQPSARLGKHMVVSLMEDPWYLTRNSAWMSRGWTFQEGLFSRRLLIFLEDQVYFECKTTTFCESMDLMNHEIPLRIFVSGFESMSTAQLNEILIQYSSRKLTNQDDAINAFLGVLRTYGRMNNIREGHYWGVPIFPPVPSKSSEVPSSAQRKLNDGFIRGLCWE